MWSVLPAPPVARPGAAEGGRPSRLPPPGPRRDAEHRSAAAAPGGRIRGLDGLRALAVAGVLLFHAGVPWARGGFLGVDAFFVISGFLITTLLLREGAGGAIALGAFWARRARRLLPALVVVVAAVGVLSALGWTDDQGAALRGDGLAALAYVANWHFIAAGQGYFSGYAAPSPFMHTWSLAIEEQFYLLWPPLVALLLRWRGVRAVGVAALIAVVLSATLMTGLAHAGASVSRLYYGSDTRAQSLLVGAILAGLLYLPRRGGSAGLRRMAGRPLPRLLATATALVAAAFGLIAATTWDNNQASLFTGQLTGFAFAMAALLAAVVVHPGGMFVRFLELRPLRALGEISYGVYLWHWPVFLVLDNARTAMTGVVLLTVRLLVTLGLAVLSYRLVEQPVRQRKMPLVGRAISLPATVALSGLVLVACTTANPGAGLAGTAAVDVNGASTDHPASARAIAARANAAAPIPHASLLPGPIRGPLRVAFLGDSVSYTLAQGLQGFAPGGDRVFDDAIIGCGVTTTSPYEYFGSQRQIETKCLRWPQTWRADLVRDRPNLVAILVGRWEVMDQVLNGRWTHIGLPDFDTYLRQQLQAAFRVASSTGCPVAFLTAPYYHRGERPDGGRWPEDDPARVDAYNRILAGVVAAHPGHAFLVPFGRVTAGGGSAYVQDVAGVQLRYDGVHFTTAAARWLSPWLFGALAHG